MRYHVAHIETHFTQDWEVDVLMQQLGDLGFDTFDTDEGGDSGLLSAYIPSDQWAIHQSEIETLCASMPAVVLKEVSPCPDENWNAAWEAEHPVEELPMGVRIVPHCAFGAGHHETTSMMVEALMNYELKIKNYELSVLDHGTGTGILAIFAKKLGASRVVAVDIDEKSVINAQENAALNGVEIDVRLGGDLTPFNFHLSPFNLILANIHRNILMDHMSQYAQALVPGGEVWISGFYEADCEPLIAAAEAQGLHPIAVHKHNEWRMIQFKMVNGK